MIKITSRTNFSKNNSLLHVRYYMLLRYSLRKITRYLRVGNFVTSNFSSLKNIRQVRRY